MSDVELPPSVDEVELQIDASVIFQLGEDLISDEVQALVELVKNSYDADADWCKVNVVADQQTPEPHTGFPNEIGFILVEDNGCGMNPSQIQSGWLTVSQSEKRKMKKEGLVTADKNRTPLGDKGLGRLGSQRLARNVEIITSPKGDENSYHISWSWDEFRSGKPLSEIKFPVRTVPPKETGDKNADDKLKANARKKQGTKIYLSGLVDPSEWNTKEAFDKFQVELSKMISPYSEIRDFGVFGHVNGTEIELTSVADRIRNAAYNRFKIKFDGNVFSISSRVKLALMRPTQKELPLFEKLIESDNGDRFFEFLNERQDASSYKLKKSSSNRWFVEFSYRRRLEQFDNAVFLDMDDPDALDQKKKVPANPGSFVAEVDSFVFRSDVVNELPQFHKLKEYRDYIKDLVGVRIYRDGFGVRIDNDWIGLGKQWTEGGSYYGLKPENVIGFVNISAKENAALIETTDREGFKQTAEFRNFALLFQQFKKFSHDTQSFLRRGYVDFKRKNDECDAGVDSSNADEQLLQKISIGLSAFSELATPSQDAKDSLSNSMESFETLSEIEEGIDDRQQKKSLSLVHRDLKGLISEIEVLIELVHVHALEAKKLHSLHQVICNRVDTLKERLAQGVEAMSLGITTESLAHELENIVEGLRQRSSKVSKYAIRKKIGDIEILKFIEHVKSTTNGFRRQLAHLTPSLRYSKTQRKEFDVGSYCNGELSGYFRDRWADERLKIKVDSSSSLKVRVNQGKIVQVLDNLIINSEYWLKHDLRAGHINEGIVTIRIKSTGVTVQDNGTGIDPAVEESLFEPFVSRKTKNARGLGLYVVQQLLESEGVDVRLSNRRNRHDRRYVFELDFSGCLINE